MFGAEPWTNQMRTEIERMLGIDAIDVWPVRGHGPGRGLRVRRSQGDGPHIWEDHFYPEIIDPGQWRGKLPDGERGELVSTAHRAKRCR